MGLDIFCVIMYALLFSIMVTNLTILEWMHDHYIGINVQEELLMFLIVLAVYALLKKHSNFELKIGVKSGQSFVVISELPLA